MRHIRQLVALEGGCNFRDLGGYKTVDGHYVRRGRLYRSGVMAYLTPQDHQTLVRLGIRCICDLRRADERRHEPTNWPDTPSVLKLSWDDERDQSVVRALPTGKSAGNTHSTMVDLYRMMPRRLVPRLSGVFERLGAADVPLVFHCSAGKDRTGLTAALILAALRVPRETILADYALTNLTVDLEQFVRSRQKGALGLGSVNQSILDLPVATRQALLAADTAYLEAALAAIEHDYGSVGEYLGAELGVTKTVLNRMHSLLLTDEDEVPPAPAPAPAA